MIEMGPTVRRAVNIFRDFMFERVYVPADICDQGTAARAIIRVLFNHYFDNHDQIPAEYRAIAESDERAIVDYLSGMTDHYAIRKAEFLEPGISDPLRVSVA